MALAVADASVAGEQFGKRYRCATSISERKVWRPLPYLRRAMRSGQPARHDESCENKQAENHYAERGEDSTGDLGSEWVGPVGSKRAPNSKHHERYCNSE